MNVRNFLKPGSQVMLVPLGIQLTLQYDADGELDKIYSGWLNRDTVDYACSIAVDRTDELVAAVRSCEYIANKINITGGTSWIWGVLYTDHLPEVDGTLPEAFTDDAFVQFQADSKSFMFFGITCASTAFTFRGYAQVSQWLRLNRFQVLSAKLAPADNQAGWISAWLHTGEWTFKPTLYMSTCTFSLGASILQDNCICMQTVTSVSKHMDVNGYITFATDLKDGTTLYVQPDDYSKYGLRCGTSLILDENTQNIEWSNTVYGQTAHTWKYCEACGAPMLTGGHVRCSNPYCYTVLYGDCCHFLSTLGLPQINYEGYMQNNLEYPVSSFSDILDFPEYRSSHVEVTLAKLLEALIPVRVVSSSSTIRQFVRQSNGVKTTVRYYLSHPDQIVSQFGAEYTQLAMYLESCSSTFLYDFDNLVESHPLVQVVDAVDACERAPIFRNVSIAVTGKFLHGDQQGVKKILESYGAKVFNSWADSLDCVIVGDCMEDNNGELLRKSRATNTPIYAESQFFSMYDIDSDLQSEC